MSKRKVESKLQVTTLSVTASGEPVTDYAVLVNMRTYTGEVIAGNNIGMLEPGDVIQAFPAGQFPAGETVRDDALVLKMPLTDTQLGELMEDDPGAGRNFGLRKRMIDTTDSAVAAISIGDKRGELTAADVTRLIQTKAGR